MVSTPRDFKLPEYADKRTVCISHFTRAVCSFLPFLEPAFYPDWWFVFSIDPILAYQVLLSYGLMAAAADSRT